MDFIIQWLKSVFGTVDNLSAFISAIAVLVAAISASVAVVGNRRSQKHYKQSILPQLSMKLIEYDYQLFLYIKNTGKTAATNITIKPITIKNNGDRELETGKLFETSFELYPEEAVQDTVAYLGSNIMYSAFPQLSVEVTYNTSVSKRETSFLRTITFFPSYTTKISADVKMDTDSIESSLKCISRATLRTANYLDGHQIAPFDEINLLAGKSLENDLKNTFGQAKPPVVSREDSITKSHRKGENQNANA